MGEYLGPSRIRVGIMGAGIAGCCLATGLLDNPHLDVELFEEHPNIRPRGSGLAFHGNAMRAMDFISPRIKEAYFKKSHFMANEEDIEMATQFVLCAGEHAGKLVAELGRAKGRRTVHRAHFIQGLLEDVAMPRVKLHFNKRVASISEDPVTNKATVSFDNGTYESFDVVFGAEGVFSPTRKYILGPDHPAANPVNHDNWRQFHTTVPMQEAKACIPQKTTESVLTYCTPYGYMMGIPVDMGQTYSVSCYQRDSKCPEKGAPFKASLWKGFLPEVDAMVSVLEKHSKEDWSLQDHDPAPTYYKGRVCMLGDAAHACFPHAGNGAAQAIEDCAILTGIFKRVSATEEIEAALKAFDEIRRPRSQRIVNITRSFGKLYTQDPEGFDLEDLRAKMREGGMYTNGVDMSAQVQAAVDAFESHKQDGGAPLK
ncbi:mannitol 1-phosphate dehydrogenase [Colletotrichum karsti]|uniref:Mannitol 1-phosphate dehydrogenase n=1 Tax=Colletotrichum karsti TaxID=1095194 RepID=A0A9P6LGF3_9PEZI|nr:mannitol 1-phosphate dehydrogenase [Colletotrichum karsti]KAF9872473.1 mannitol 1-phosphate dehydrogenase [Colletotrichum karsti]